MENNACYKYHTIKRFVDALNGAPIRTILEVGTNVGNVTAEMAKCFPEARIVTYEPVKRYAERAAAKLQDIKQITLRTEAITSAHLFEDDFGRIPRKESIPIHIYLGLPAAGPGYEGGSFVAPPGLLFEETHKELEQIACRTLEEAMADMLSEGEELDYLKTDSEGAECSFLGSASEELLKRIRYIAGEYHDIKRFWPVAQKLMATHLVNIIGDHDLGAFFCERRTPLATILQKIPLPPIYYNHLHTEPLWWHPFDEKWVLPKERLNHGIIDGKPTAYIVCGPIRSGNRILASILVRSGCHGNAGTQQPRTAEDLPAAERNEPYVIIVHEHVAWWADQLRNKGFQRIVAIMIIREPIATIQSALKGGHPGVYELQIGMMNRKNTIVSTISELVARQGIEFEILTYEGLCEEMLRIWLPSIGLRYVPGSLVTPGQEVADHIANQNKKHYVTYFLTPGIN